MDNKKLAVGGVILVALLVVWYVAVVSVFEKMPEDYSFDAVLDGTERPNYDVSGTSTEFIAYSGVKKNKVIRVDGEILEIEAHFKAEELSGEPLYEIRHDYGVDRKTRKIIPGYNRDGYFLPPIGLEKKSYIIQNPTLLVNLEYKFKRIDTIKGLKVYLFEGELNNLDTTEGYEFLSLVPEKYTAVDDIDEQVWIEPKTGVVVDFKQSGKSFYIEDGKRIHQFTHYTNSFSEDTITTQAIKAQNEKFKLLLVKTIIPALLAVVMLIVTLFISWRENTK